MSVRGKIEAAWTRWFTHEFTISDRGLALCRICYALSILLLVVPGYITHSAWITALPDVLHYPPPGPMMVFDGFFSLTTIYALILLIVLSASSLLLGFKTRASALLLGLCLLLFDGNLYAVGKIDHGRVLLSWFPIVMAFSSWGNALTLRDAWTKDARAHTTWPYKLFALILAFGLFTAGVPKLLGGWLSTDSLASYTKLYSNYHALHRQELLAPMFISLGDWRIFWELQDWLTVAFEVGFLASLYSTRTFRFFLVCAVLFHWGVMLSMNIVFPEQFLIYIMFIDWSALENKDPKLLIGAWLLVCACALIPLQFANIPVHVWLIYLLALPLIAWFMRGHLRALRRRLG